MLRDWWLRLRSLLHAETVDRDLDDELAFHLEQYVVAAVARGVSRDAAIQQAHIALGGLDQIREAHRDARGVGMVADAGRDLRFALRMFRRLPGFTAAALIVLALGIAATTVLFTVIDGVLLKPLPYPQSDRLVALHVRSEAVGETWGFSYPDFLDLRRDSRSARLAAWAYGGGTLVAPGDAAHVESKQLSAEVFSVLNVPLVRGRGFLPVEDQPGAAPVAIISYELWQERYGGRATAVGQPLLFDAVSYTVVGIAPAGFRLGDQATDVFTPLGQNREVRMRNREARFIHVLGRLTPGATLGDARSEMALIGQRLAAAFPASNAHRDLIARPMLQEIVGDVESTLWLLLAAVALVLLIACVNVASLLLARAVARSSELSTRIALGASRARIVRQCLTESGLLGLAGGALAVPLAVAGVGPFVRLWPGELPRAGDIHLDWRVLLVALTVSLVCGLAFGIVPALRASTTTIDPTLRAGGRTAVRGHRRAYGAFVITEVALAVLLLVTAGTLVRTLAASSSRDPGVQVSNTLSARVALSPDVLGDPGRLQAVWTELLDRVRQVPGVERAALTDIVPMRTGENSLSYSTAADVPSSEAPVALQSTISPDYFRVMGIPLRDGRFFDEHDRLDSEQVLIVDEQLALHAFGRTDVAGRQLWVPALGPRPMRIVGVVGHVRHWGLAADDRAHIRDQMYAPFAQVPPRLLGLFSSLMSLTVRTRATRGALLDIVEPLRAALAETSAGSHAIYDIQTTDGLVRASLARERFLAFVFASFSGVALLLACVGIYGVFSYSTNQRAREFGVRLALGSSAASIVRLVLRQSALLVVAGLAVGSGAAWVVGRLLQRLIEGAPAPGPATFLVTFTLFATAAMAASFFPARRAGRVDLARTLNST